MEFIGLVTSDKDSWSQVESLVKKYDWDNIFIVTDQEAISALSTGKKHELIRINTAEKIIEMKSDLIKKLKNKISGTEVALSIASGTGKEHMALISALLNIPVGIRFVAMTKDGIVNL